MNEKGKGLFFKAWVGFLITLSAWGCKPTNPYLYLERAENEYKRGDYDKAIQFYEKALKLKSDLPSAYYGIGLAYYQKREINKAIAMYHKAQAMDPKMVEAYYQEALIYQLMGHDKQYEAIPLYEKVLEIRPGFKEARKNLGMMYEQMGAFAQALELYKKGHDRDPSDRDFEEGLRRVESQFDRTPDVEPPTP